jgi:hypothetical protein
MSAERGKTPLVPPWPSNPETRVEREKRQILFEKKTKRLITLKRFPIRFSKFP